MGKFGHLLCTVATTLLLKHFTFNREKEKKRQCSQVSTDAKASQIL